MYPIAALKQLVRDIAQTEIMPRFLHTTTQRKADGSLLTEADLATQAALTFRLPEIVPAPVLGEEMPFAEQRQCWAKYSPQTLWIVDPIDGTTNFANGLPHFALSVALINEGRPVMAVIYNPVSQELFSATLGGGAFLNDTPLPIRPSAKRLGEAVAGVEVKRLRSGHLSTRIHTLSPVRSIRSMGSSTLDWCYLASGRYDVYVHGGQMLWDYAAGALIYSEAGGQLATLEGDEFWSGKHTFKRSVIGALDPVLFETWRDWIMRNR